MGGLVMDIDWSMFQISSDRDGEMEFSHEKKGCYGVLHLNTYNYTDVMELMKLAEEHLKTCPVWTGE